MIGSLGPVVFQVSTESVKTINDLERGCEARFSEHTVAQGKPLLEFLGPGLDSVSFSMRFDLSWGMNPRIEIETLRAVRDNGVAQLLIIGGIPLGLFVITGITESWKTINPAGVLTVATVAISLKEYVKNAGL
ncbi:phage tail protein [Aminobacterium sp. MB27-C1]|uniref:phage tail protein n=1 Tax=Aminobacterium sp. MB27-C1 TaxID=3070661 RepID=UPI0027DC3DBA|nr:phage tail protein [Aminobacterium sp. MB27-C1]WMI72137.1 phage tail protein [Aminobacterium sp. MB27-C1]